MDGGGGGGWGAKQKTFRGGEYRYFLELHILLIMSLMMSSYKLAAN